MEKSNNFSLISNIKTKNFLGENFYKSNVFVPQTPRPVGGVGSTGLDQSNIRQNYLEDNNNLLPYLGSEVWKNMFHPNTTVLFYRGCPQIISCTQKLARKILINAWTLPPQLWSWWQEVVHQMTQLLHNQHNTYIKVQHVLNKHYILWGFFRHEIWKANRTSNKNSRYIPPSKRWTTIFQDIQIQH